MGRHAWSRADDWRWRLKFGHKAKLTLRKSYGFRSKSGAPQARGLANPARQGVKLSPVLPNGYMRGFDACLKYYKGREMQAFIGSLRLTDEIGSLAKQQPTRPDALEMRQTEVARIRWSWSA